MSKIIMKGVVLFFSLFFIPFYALAQMPPPGQDAGPQAERFKKESQQEQERFEKKKSQPPEINVEEKPQAPPAQGAAFILKRIVIVGATVFSPEELQSIYQPYLEKTVTFSDIESIISQITAKYKARGFLTTTGYIPEQEIKEGVVEIRILEGKLGNLNIEGNNYFSKPLIEKYFHVKKMKFLI